LPVNVLPPVGRSGSDLGTLGRRLRSTYNPTSIISNQLVSRVGTSEQQES
jgi:hypothetical protein